MTEALAQRAIPPTSPASEAFWEATRRRELVLPWCLTCEAPIWYPRETCPRCLGSGIEWRSASGRGVVYAVTVEHRPQNPGMRPIAPYAVALVDLDEGVRILSSIVGCAPEQVRVGTEVSLSWEPLPDGRHLPVFEPVAGSTGAS